MQIGKTLFSALTGTTAMTVFSYLISRAEGKNFREPQVLGKLIERLPAHPPKPAAQVAGWCAHYAIGLSFVALYSKLWKQKEVKPTVISGALLGAASGLVGIAAWKGMFEMHPNPPAKNLKPFLGHLMLAHVVFGVFSALSFKDDKRRSDA